MTTVDAHKNHHRCGAKSVVGCCEIFGVRSVRGSSTFRGFSSFGLLEMFFFSFKTINFQHFMVFCVSIGRFEAFYAVCSCKHTMRLAEECYCEWLRSRELQALHGSLNICASDCGYRRGDVRLKPKTSTKHTNALIQAMILNISSPLTEIVLYSQTAPIYNNSFEVCAIVLDHSWHLHNIRIIESQGNWQW